MKVYAIKTDEEIIVYLSSIKKVIEYLKSIGDVKDGYYYTKRMEKEWIGYSGENIFDKKYMFNITYLIGSEGYNVQECKVE